MTKMLRWNLRCHCVQREKKYLICCMMKWNALLNRCAAITLLALQSHFGDTPVKFQVLCPQNGTAVLKVLTSANMAPVGTYMANYGLLAGLDKLWVENGVVNARAVIPIVNCKHRSCAAAVHENRLDGFEDPALPRNC